MRRPSEEVLRLIKSRIDEATPAGPRREALYMRFLLGREPIPRRKTFMEAYLYVLDKKTGIPVHWIFNRPQRMVDAIRERQERFGEPIRHATLKSRQWGMTTKWLGDGIEMCIRSPHTKAAIVAHTGEKASGILEDGKQMILNLPVKLPVERSNRRELKFGDPLHSILEIASAEEKEPLRSGTRRMVHCTEPAFWLDATRKATSIMQVVPRAPGTVLSWESTGRGEGDWWHTFWYDCREGRNDYTAFFFPWYWDPDFDFCQEITKEEAKEIFETLDDEEKTLLKEGVVPGQLKWRRSYIANECFGNLDTFHQEYCATPEEAFAASGQVVFAPEHVAAARARVEDPIFIGDIIYGQKMAMGPKDPPRLVEDPHGPLKIWRMPSEGHFYAGSIDSCYGIKGGDPAAMLFGDAHTRELVAQYHRVMDQPTTALKACLLGWFFANEEGPAYVMPEMEGPGSGVCQAMIDVHDYYNIALRPSMGRPGNAKQQMWGWSTNVSSKGRLIEKIAYQLSLREEGFQVYSKDVLEELAWLRADLTGAVTRFAAPQGRHDDLVITLGILLVTLEDLQYRNVLEKEPKIKPRTMDEIHWAQFQAGLTASHRQDKLIGF